MKEKLTRNIGLKILSIILAALLWLVITNVDDPMTSVPFFNVPVEILNANKITGLGQVYNITEGETINFTASARRKIADKLSISDFKVTADFSKLSDVNAVTIDISCPSYDGDVDITSGLYQVMKVNREELTEKHFKINVEQKGEPAEGYYVYEKTVNTILRVSGPKSKIDSIAEVVVNVDVTEVSGSFATKEIPKAIDADGNEIDASNLTFSENVVSVNIGMYKTKKINLKIETTGTPANGYVMTGVAEYEPKTVEVAGSDEALNNIDELNVEESIEGATQNIKEQIDLQEQLEEGLILVGDSQTAVVNITIEKAETKELTIWPGDIDVQNKSEHLNLTYLTTGPIVITVSGPAEEVKDISRDSLKPYIDLSGYSNGTYIVKIGVSLNEHSTLKNIPQVNIQLIS